MKKSTFILLLLLCFALPTNAQFFKKLGKSVEKAAEKAIEKKAEQKTTKETEKAFDSTFNKKRKTNKKINNKSKGGSSIPGLSKATSAETYTFNHKAVMQVINGKEVMDVDYFLPKSGSYFGMAIKDKRMEGDFMMVYDIEQEAMFTFMNNGGQKIKMAVAINLDESSEEVPEYDIKATGNTKKILGYNCQEYKMTGKNITATIWVTKEVDIRFPNTFHNTKKNKGNNQEWMKDLDGWAMEMTMIDTSQKKPQTITMKCLSIEKSTLQINSNDYKSLGY